MIDDQVRIAELGKKCNYLRYWSTTNTPQPCGQPATSLVLVPNAPRQGGQPTFRCDDHKGMLSTRVCGTVVEAMPRKLVEG